MNTREEAKIVSVMLLLIFLSLVIDLWAHYFLKKNSIDYKWPKQQIILISCIIGLSLLLEVVVFFQKENRLDTFLMLVDGILLLFYPNPIGYKNNVN